MNVVKKSVVILLALCGLGLARFPIETRLSKKLQEAELLDAGLSLAMREKIGQESYAITLGGLRSLVAAMKNLEAHTHFEDQEWFEVEETYKTITALQPHTRYYWEAASWHLAYNAFSDYGDRPNLPSSLRKQRQTEFLNKGSQFLTQATRLNPRDWKVWHLHARLWSDPLKQPDFPRAAELFEKTIPLSPIQTNLQREYFYTLSRIPVREPEALELVKKLWEDPANRRFPTLRCLLYVLQQQPKYRSPLIVKIPQAQIFPNQPTALRDLRNYWIRRKQGYPTHGVKDAIIKLEKDLRIPEDKRFFNQKNVLPTPNLPSQINAKSI